MDDYEKRAQDYYDRKVARAEGTLIWIAWIWAIFVMMLLLGCHSPERELIYDTDQCLQKEMRAAMICSKGHCYIQCR